MVETTLIRKPKPALTKYGWKYLPYLKDLVAPMQKVTERLCSSRKESRTGLLFCQTSSRQWVSCLSKALQHRMAKDYSFEDT